MYLVYSIVLVFWGILLLPIFLYKAWRHHKRLPGLSQRMGRLAGTLKFNGRATIWFHSCSVGETLSLEPLVPILRRRFPEARFVFSTITETGQAVAIRRFSSDGDGNTFYFPIDLASVVNRVLDWIQPAILVIVDTEIWPNLMNETHHRNIPVMLINGRISASSFRYYRLAKRVLWKVFRNYRILLMQSEEDARRIAEIGAPAEKIAVTGNIKFDRDLTGNNSHEKTAGELADSLGISDAENMLIVAGSTHPGEEQLLLEVLQRIRTMPNLEKTRLLLAPRHPERFEETASLIARNGFLVRRRTGHSNHEAQNAEVLLLDTIGELAAAYQYATIAFVGGTLDRNGGHSIMEPAFYSKPIVAGPSMENFRGIVDEFKTKGGIRQINATYNDRERQREQLTQVFSHLLNNAVERKVMGEIAFSLLEKNRGAASRTAEMIASIFEESVERKKEEARSEKRE
jgi:3-deoxy-D-manno-octulosonic-acid transferase